MWLQNYKTESHKQQLLNLDTERTKIARVSLHTKNKLRDLQN